MHYMPPKSHSARVHFTDDMIRDTLVPIGTGEAPAPVFRHAFKSAVETMAKNPAIRAVNIICLRANDDLVMMQVGPRGGHRCIWNFTTGKAAY